eukprot:6190620-Prymnesium_polylepis.2
MPVEGQGARWPLNPCAEAGRRPGWCRGVLRVHQTCAPAHGEWQAHYPEIVQQLYSYTIEP